jgi:hypothetical protein
LQIAKAALNPHQSRVILFNDVYDEMPLRRAAFAMGAVDDDAGQAKRRKLP